MREAAPLKWRQYQELNEPRIFAWRYIPKKGIWADRVLRVELDTLRDGRRVPATPVVVTLRWRNRARRIADMAAYDERNRYCLLGEVRFDGKRDWRLAMHRHAKAYLERLYAVDRGIPDALHMDGRNQYFRYKQALRRRLRRGADSAGGAVLLGVPRSSEHIVRGRAPRMERGGEGHGYTHHEGGA